MPEVPERSAFPPVITPEMEARFRPLFLDWLDRNQEALEAGGTGDVRALMSLLFLPEAQADEVDMVCVPRHPTNEMLDAAYYAATDEDATGVWERMIEVWLQKSKSGNSEAGRG
jgi:hypothetical protein